MLLVRCCCPPVHRSNHNSPITLYPPLPLSETLRCLCSPASHPVTVSFT